MPCHPLLLRQEAAYSNHRFCTLKQPLSIINLPTMLLQIAHSASLNNIVAQEPSRNLGVHTTTYLGYRVRSALHHYTQLSWGCRNQQQRDASTDHPMAAGLRAWVQSRCYRGRHAHTGASNNANVQRAHTAEPSSAEGSGLYNMACPN